MNSLFSNRFPNHFQKRSLPAKLLTLALLVALIAAGWRIFSMQNQGDLSFLLPIYQDGEQLSPSAIIGESGQVLLPVAAIAERNGWLAQQNVLTGKSGLWGQSLLLIDESAGATLAVCWFGSQPEVIDSLGVLYNGLPLGLSAPGRLWQGQLYLPEDFFTAAFDLSLKLDAEGRANLIPGQPAEQPAA